MELVFQEAVKEMEQGKACVIATVTHTQGSTPQKPGAKLLVRLDGSGAGTLGGGCVEGDIWFAAKMVLQRGGGPEITEYNLNEDIAARDGLVCGGTMFFLMDPVWKPQETLPYLHEILGAYRGGKPVALATLLKPPKGSKLQVGAKLLVREDGTRMGTLGSARLDDEAAKSGLPLMAYGKEHYLKTADGAEVFLEAYTTPAKLVLMGGGHVNKAVSALAKSVGFRIYVIDDRPEFANPERFPMAEATIVKDYAEGLGDVPINTNTFIVVGTRGHREDDRALAAAALTPAGYVALMGSKRKVILIYEELLKRGISVERLRQIHSPVGLDIHARTPEEIAVSIVAELIQFRLGGTGASMKLEERRLVKIVEKVRKQQEDAVAVAS